MKVVGICWNVFVQVAQGDASAWKLIRSAHTHRFMYVAYIYIYKAHTYIIYIYVHTVANNSFHHHRRPDPVERGNKNLKHTLKLKHMRGLGCIGFPASEIEMD